LSKILRTFGERNCFHNARKPVPQKSSRQCFLSISTEMY